jgi:hypothetical protein
VGDLPSWTPGWSSEWDTNLYAVTYCKWDIRWDLPRSNDDYDGNFSAGSHCEPTLTFKSVDARELLVIRGLVHYRIIATSPILGNAHDYNPFEYLLRTIELIKDMANSCTPTVTLDTQVIVSTLLYDAELNYDGQDIFTPLDDINASTRLTPELLATLTDYVLNDRGPPNADFEKLYVFLAIRMSNLGDHRIS